jgi:transcription elongation factor Elf1
MPGDVDSEYHVHFNEWHCPFCRVEFKDTIQNMAPLDMAQCIYCGGLSQIDVNEMGRNFMNPVDHNKLMAVIDSYWWRTMVDKRIKKHFENEIRPQKKITQG